MPNHGIRDIAIERIENGMSRDDALAFAKTLREAELRGVMSPMDRMVKIQAERQFAERYFRYRKKL